MKLQLLVSEGLLLLHYTQTAIYSAKFQFWSIWLSQVSCTYLSWNVYDCHYHQYLNTSQTTDKCIFLHLFKDIIVTIHTLHIRKITLHVWGQRGCWAKARNAVWFFWFPLPQRKMAWGLVEASLETLFFPSFSWEYSSVLVAGYLKWSISLFFGQKG